MLWLAEKLVAEETPVANIIFHSSELLAGGSPYNTTRDDVERFYVSLEALLRLLAEKGVEGRTFHELRDEWVGEDRS
jgi:hypothetical protein